MFWEINLGPEVDEGKMYASATEYGIVCKVQDLNLIVERLDKYFKKTKVRGAGLMKKFGWSHFERNTGVECWSEWIMMGGFGKVFVSFEQGGLWHFELMPNRHYHIDHRKNDTAKEVFAFPERKDLPYNIILIKNYWFYEHHGKKVYADSDEERQKREVFFQGLLDCIGFPLEVLYTYDKNEERIFR